MDVFFRLALLIVFLIEFSYSKADGSKDLYPAGVRGSRAVLESENNSSNPFFSNCKHFVYARYNETLAIASSAQGIEDGITIIRSPSGRIIINNGIIGQIRGRNGMSNRQAELAGPRIGYDAYEIPVNEEGIWTIEFLSPTGNEAVQGRNNSYEIPDVLADENWIQTMDRNYILAWDISVRNADNDRWISGRVYTKVLNLFINGGELDNPNKSFYGRNYVLTKDGYIYKVDGNGSIGLRFTYFVNNTGLLDNNGNPTYKSSNEGYNAIVHNPNSLDVENRFITHKIFYSLPSQDLPNSSFSSQGNDWLLNDIQFANISNVRFDKYEIAGGNRISLKGAKVSFDTNYAGKYKVTISSSDSNYYFEPRILIVNGVIGNNIIHWNSRDGNDNLLPIGLYNINVTVAAIDGEVHFPYFDMEINPNGIMLEKVSRDGTILGSATVYWDDSDISNSNSTEASNPLVNLTGISSSINGHRWGTYTATPFLTGSNQYSNAYTGGLSFGNNKAMDTWSYAVQVEEVLEEEIQVEFADLEIVSIEVNRDSVELDQEVRYTVRFRNNGPSNVIGSNFLFTLPEGFQITNANVSVNCGLGRNRAIQNNHFSMLLDLQNNCEGIVVLVAKANNVPDETFGTIQAFSGITRSIGVTDLDATSFDTSVSTIGTAEFECGGHCNNVKYNNDVYLLEPYHERGQLQLKKTVRHIDANNSLFQEVGEELIYTFTILNSGQVRVKNISVEDKLFEDPVFPITGLSLMPGESYSFNVSYVLKNKDIIARQVVNTAKVFAKNPRNFDIIDISGTEFNNDSPTIIDIDLRPKLQLKQSVLNSGTGENNQFTLGDEIIYQLEVKHEGQLAIQNIRFVNPILNSLSFSNILSRILNTTAVIQAKYVITEEDIKRGYVISSTQIIGDDEKYGFIVSDISGNTFENDIPSRTVLAQPYIVKNDHMSVFQGTQGFFNILSNDTPGSSGITNNAIEIVSSSPNADITIKDGIIHYSYKEKLFSGDDFFTYRIKDRSNLFSEIARVDVFVRKTKPIANDDYFNRSYHTSNIIDITKNDYVHFSNLDLNRIKIISDLQNGKLTDLGGGKFQYELFDKYSGYVDFTYVIADENGNWSDPAKVVIEARNFIIPNTITPNGDKKNDTFEILGIHLLDRIELEIINRFGKTIYLSTDYRNNWEVPATITNGTYYYIVRGIKSGEKDIVRKGYVLITREQLSR